MRKLISLGILALLLSMLASPVLADLEDCKDLKEDGITKGLYGLCIAYWNADNGNSQERILANYNQKNVEVRETYHLTRRFTLVYFHSFRYLIILTIVSIIPSVF